MAGKQDVPNLKRRHFLKGAGLAGAAAIAAPLNVVAQTRPAETPKPVPLPNKPAETATAARARSPDRGQKRQRLHDRLHQELGFEYMAANPASSFRGLHESLINYGGNKDPNSSPAATRKSRWPWDTAITRSRASRCASLRTVPSACITRPWRCNNAWCDRVPVYVVIGKCEGRAAAPTGHRVESQRAGSGFGRARLHQWDDNPGSLQHFAESAVRA